MPIIDTLLALADQYPRYGFAKCFAVLRRQVMHGIIKGQLSLSTIEPSVAPQREKTTPQSGSCAIGKADGGKPLLVNGFYE